MKARHSDLPAVLLAGPATMSPDFQAPAHETRQPGPEVRQIPQLRPKLHGRPTSNGSGGSRRVWTRLLRYAQFACRRQEVSAAITTLSNPTLVSREANASAARGAKS